MTHSHDSFAWGMIHESFAWLIRRSYVTWLIRMTHSHDSFAWGMIHDSFAWLIRRSYVTWLILIRTCDSYVSFIYVTWLIRDTTYSSTCCNSNSPQLNTQLLQQLTATHHTTYHMCDMTHVIHIRRHVNDMTWLTQMWMTSCYVTHSYYTWLMHIWRDSFDSFIFVTWLVRMWHDSLVWGGSFTSDETHVTWPIQIWYSWHHSFVCDSSALLLVHCNALQHTTATYYGNILLQHTATHCNTLQHTATHCNTLQSSLIGGLIQGEAKYPGLNASYPHG